jgi:hypothetical protein
MRVIGNSTLFLALALSTFAQQDPGCPGYPAAVRSEWEDALASDQAYVAYAARAKRLANKNQAAATYPRDSFVDHALFAKMAADGVAPAPIASDAEFLRRVHLDLTGRVPQPQEAEAFFADKAADKRVQMIAKLISSPAFVDQFTLYFANKFKVTRGAPNGNVSLAGRNVFHAFLKDFVQRDRPYNEFVSEMLTATGDVDTTPGAQFFSRNIAEDGPIQDTWDNTTDIVTTQLLGYKTECVSCHNGRGYLDKINLYLTRRTRQDFWQMSAFLSRMQFLRWSDDQVGTGFRPRITVIERNYGNYSGGINNNPGNRPARGNMSLDPMWMLSGEEVKPGANFRQELARLLTNDRQFARATVNSLWAYFFNAGIVDPPDAWDFMRTDPKQRVPAGWPFQNAHPELLEQLTDHFIQSNYSIREVARLITSSTAYQLSARYEGDWDPAFERYFARRTPRRLSAEELYDSITTATRTEAPMTVLGWDMPVIYGNQLPDPTEPATDGGVTNLMAQFGRGNWTNLARSNDPNLLGLLYSMNDSFVVHRTLGNTANFVVPNNRVHQINARNIDDDEAIRQIYLATLTRYPTDMEIAIVKQRRAGNRDVWLSDLQWALLNKLDFIFNY